MANVNMSEVARMADVSIATVSHVINNTRYVADDTRRRVLESIDTLGYRPNLMARIFKTGKKNLIGFIVPDIANAFFATIIEEVEKIIGKSSYRLIVSNTKETPERELENVGVLANGIVDGLIIASTLNSYQALEHLIPSDVPHIFIDRAIADCPKNSIVVSNYYAIYEAVEALIHEGHTRIGYITGLAHLSTTQERLSAYRSAMEAHGLPIDAHYICVGTSMHNESNLNAEKLIGLGCTAIIVSNNVMTDDVLYYLDKQNLRDRIAVVGYNDSGYRNYALRNIYSIKQPAAELGRTAGAQIVSLIENPDQSIEQVSLKATFIRPE